MKLMKVILALSSILFGILEFGYTDSIKIEDFPSYEIVDLGVLGADESEAIAVNDLGQVLGKLKDNGIWQIFLWDEKNGLQLLDLPKDSNVSLNNSGQIAGTYLGGVFLWSSSTGMFNIGSFDGGKLTVNKINDQGQLLITSHSKDLQSFHGTSFYKSNIYLWDRDFTINLTQEFNKQLPYYSSIVNANAMNNNSEVVVTSYVPYLPPNKNKAEIILKSFLWKNGKFQELFAVYIPNKNVNVSHIDDGGNMILRIDEREFFYSPLNGVIELEGFNHSIIINNKPQIVYCLPSKLKKKTDGFFYFTPGAEIRKLFKNTYPYWSNYAKICDQNSYGYVVGRSETIYPRQQHAFLAIPKINESTDLKEK